MEDKIGELEDRRDRRQEKQKIGEIEGDRRNRR